MLTDPVPVPSAGAIDEGRWLRPGTRPDKLSDRPTGPRRWGRIAAMGVGGGRSLKRIGEPRRHWGWRAAVLALIGGLVGWIVAYVRLLMGVQKLSQIHGSFFASFD